MHFRGSRCECVCGMGKGVNVSCTPLPTRLQGYIVDSASLVSRYSAIKKITLPFCILDWRFPFLVACYANTPALSVGLSVRHSLLFFVFCGLFCFCPNDQVISNTAPAHPHATGVAVYPALSFYVHGKRRVCMCACFQIW